MTACFVRGAHSCIFPKYAREISSRMQLFYCRLHLEKPWRAGGGTKALTTESGAERAPHENTTDGSQLSTVRLPGGRDGENSCVGSDDALAPGASDGGGSSGSRKEEGSRGMAVGKALCEEPDWSRRAREVSGVSLRALQSTGAFGSNAR